MRPAWITVAEQTPPERTMLIVCQTANNDRIFAGWRTPPTWGGADRWWTYLPEVGLAAMGDMRTTDFWLSLPQWPADFGVYESGYPA